MSDQILSLTSEPNQQFDCTLSIDGKNKALSFFVNYNEEADCWMMKISDAGTGECIIDSVPLVTGFGSSANILYQHSYLAIGSAYLINMAGSSQDRPDNTNLGTDWILIWGDTET